jgi:phage shock protein A
MKKEDLNSLTETIQESLKELDSHLADVKEESLEMRNRIQVYESQLIGLVPFASSIEVAGI